MFIRWGDFQSNQSQSWAPNNLCSSHCSATGVASHRRHRTQRAQRCRMPRAKGVMGWNLRSFAARGILHRCAR
eukprot:14190608-Alexandrium_andersonii.AAC.1